ncbi:hypothetical protein ACLK11_05865 [Escherichia coli]
MEIADGNVLFWTMWLVKARSTTCGDFSSGSNFVTLYFSHFLSSRVTDAANGVRSRFWHFIQKQTMAYKEANPVMFVRIIALPTARVMNTNNSRCCPWEDKKR